MEQKRIINADLDKVLLNTDTIENAINTYINWNKPENDRIKYKELSFTLWGNFLVILTFLFIYSIICTNKWYDAYKTIKGKPQPHLDRILLEKARESMKYTAIGRIVIKENEKTKYLLDNQFFLPHCNMKANETIEKQHNILTTCLFDDFGIKENEIISIKPVDSKVHHSIKPIHGTVQMNAFVFYDVAIKEQYKEKILYNNSEKKWLTIDEMKSNSIAMATNSDVIDLLDRFPTPSDSFINILGNLKIIWNITSKCSYNCAICATYDENRNELNAADKLKVLNSICSAKHLIKNVDFAGGDPLHIDESTNIIQSAIQQLGKDRVSITTTGKGISESSEIESLNAVRHCEITIDAAHNTLSSDNQFESEKSFSRAESSYINDNLENIRLISERAEIITINVPIINDDLSDNEINTLVEKIKWIKNHTSGNELDVSLIRLMPVGKTSQLFNKEEYKGYNPINVAHRIQKALHNENIKCKLHCSLRILPEFSSSIKDKHCNMLESKIGIDCAGNVYACAWGGYLQTKNPPTKNPMYLGNLTKVPLIKILDNKSRTPQERKIMSEINNKNYRDYCSVVSYYFNKDLFSNGDPLSKT